MKTSTALILTACSMLLASPCLPAQTTISPGISYQFTQSHKSTARYLIALPYPGEYKINLSNWISTYNWGDDYDRIYLYNDEGKTVQRGEFSSDGDPFAFHMFQSNDSLIFRVGTAGTYTIDIHSGNIYPTLSQSYGLQITSTHCNDSREPNDTRTTASPIALGATVTGYQWKKMKTSAVQGDEDWYAISIPGPGKLTITLSGWTELLNWSADFDRLYVYNAAGTNIGGDVNDTYGGYYTHMMYEDPETIEMNLAKGGTYYLRFHSGDATSTTPYSFSTSFTPAADSFETNDSFDYAKPILKSDTFYNACAWRSLDQTMNVAGDEDFYYFYAAGPGSYTVTLENWISTYNWSADYDRMHVYNAAQQSVGASPLSWMMGTTPVTFDVPAAGRYYIQLHCGTGYATTGYRIKLTGNLLGPEIAVEQPLNTNLTDGKAVSSFGKASIGTIKTKTYTIRNKGVTNLTLSKITKSGAASTSFTLRQPSRLVLAPGKTTSFKVIFKPKTTGILNAAIQIRSNDKNESPFDIKLTGRGVK